MRHVAGAIEIAGFGCLVAGVFLLAGLGWALVAGGVLAIAGAVAVERSAG